MASRERGLALQVVSANLAKLAARDLTARIVEDLPVAYKALTSDFNNAVEKLAGALIEVHQATSAMTGGSAEIANAADDLARRTEQQAASLEETSAAMSEITSIVATAAKSAERAGVIVSGAREDAHVGGAVIKRTIEAMSRIERSSSEISQIVGLIDEIAFQTNLLALNAGVEAARAGDAGRGFAVVATEVRALAQRSAEAARQIKKLIANSSSEVQEGVGLANETGAALDKIIAKVVEVEQVVAAIVSGAREQSVSLSQVNAAVGQMDQTTQQNAAMVEETTAAAKALGSESQRLDRLVGAFKATATPSPHQRVPMPVAHRAVRGPETTMARDRARTG